jgi:hypothetical protein
MPLCVFRRENSGFGGWDTSQYPGTTCNNFIANLLFLSEVSHSLLVAAPLRTPLFGEMGPASRFTAWLVPGA